MKAAAQNVTVADSGDVICCQEISSGLHIQGLKELVDDGVVHEAIMTCGGEFASLQVASLQVASLQVASLQVASMQVGKFAGEWWVGDGGTRMMGGGYNMAAVGQLRLPAWFEAARFRI